MADKFGIEFRSVQREIDIEVDAVEGALWGIHALEVFFEVLSAEVGCQGDDFLYACKCVS